MEFIRPAARTPHVPPQGGPAPRTTQPPPIATAEKPILPPLTSKAPPVRSTTITITLRSKTSTISLEEENQAQPTSSESASPTQSESETSPEAPASRASSTQAPTITTTSTTPEPSITPVTTFGLGDGRQLVHSGALTGTALATDRSTFTAPPPTHASNTAKSVNRLPKPVMMGIVASSCIALVSLMAVIFWCSYRDKHKRRKKRDGRRAADQGDEESGFRNRMRQSSQVKRMKISHPFTAVYEQPATVSVRDLQDSAPWNIPKPAASGSSQNVLLPRAPSTSEAISPYGGHTTSDRCAGNSSPLASNTHPPWPALKVQQEQAEIREPVRGPLDPVSPPQDQSRSRLSSYNPGQSSYVQRPQLTFTRAPKIQTPIPRESIWDDAVSIVGPYIDTRRDAYPGRPRVGEEDRGKRPSLEQDRRVSSIVSDHHHTSSGSWQNTGLTTFSVASSHPSLRIPERGDWKQSDRGIRETMASNGEDIWNGRDYDPRNELTVKREEIEGLRVSTILANNRWESARKLFSGGGS